MRTTRFAERAARLSTQRAPGMIARKIEQVSIEDYLHTATAIEGIDIEGIENIREQLSKQKSEGQSAPRVCSAAIVRT